MTLAEKLVEVGNNRPKLYKKGALDFSPQETVSGEAIGITDISPIEHNMAVSVRGKNLIPYDNYTYKGKTTTINGITFTDNGDGTFTANGTATGNVTYIFIHTNKPVQLIKGETYTISSGVSNASGWYMSAQTTDYKQSFSCVASKTTFTAPNLPLYMYVNISSGVTMDNVVFKPMIEKGTTATSYAPYIEDISTVKLFKSGEGTEPVMYDVPTDGVVEGVTSLYPFTTLYTDTSGAVIDCTYYQDGKKVKENLTDMILSLGGVINE